MYLKRPGLWITIVVLLEIISIVVGCTPTDLPPTTAQIEPQNTGTLSVTDQTEPILEPSQMLTTPVLKPLTTEVPPSDVPNPTADPVSLLNPGFENQETNGIPSGWNHTGAAGASSIENRGHSRDSRLTHQSSEAYQVETWQTISGLENDWYTFRAWARSSGGSKQSILPSSAGTTKGGGIYLPHCRGTAGFNSRCRTRLWTTSAPSACTRMGIRIPGPASMTLN